MRKALIVGINYYENSASLWGCVNDAEHVEKMLESHGDDKNNFDCLLRTTVDGRTKLKRGSLKDDIENLFKEKNDIALFYFSGHGHVTSTGGYLLTPEAHRGDDGIALSEILSMANKSPATNKIIILDSCHSGIAGTSPMDDQITALAEGVTILTASTKDQYATERDGSGVFTNLLIDALGGAAANITGDITPGSIYAHIDQSLGAWEQRPVFKTNVTRFVSLRSVTPAIPMTELKRISEFFPSPGFEYQLDPSYEPEMKGRDEGMPDPILPNTQVFSILQKYNRLGLLVPVDAPHMWHAAMLSKACKLTALGEHYRRLAEKRRIK